MRHRTFWNEQSSGYRRVGLYRQPLHPATHVGGPSGTHHGAQPEARSRRARYIEGSRRGAGRAFILRRRRSRKRRRLAGSRHRCEYVLHVASPLPPGVPKHEDQIKLQLPLQSLLGEKRRPRWAVQPFRLRINVNQSVFITCDDDDRHLQICVFVAEVKCVRNHKCRLRG